MQYGTFDVKVLTRRSSYKMKDKQGSEEYGTGIDGALTHQLCDWIAQAQ